jgi:NAD-dependent SIR2 family protein deacetylase
MDTLRDRSTDGNAGSRLRDWMRGVRRIFVLTGAGCSTSSGIPDYRNADGAWKRKPPVTYQAFVDDSATYRRYWARSFVGWPRFLAARPNAAHHALAALEASGTLSILVTQNVDGLHQRAGSAAVVDLHGRLDDVVCLVCGQRSPRSDLQFLLAGANAGWRATHAGLAPDGDADIGDDVAAGFQPPSCSVCAGLLKPDVVFFGENVPRLRYQTAVAALQASDAMLVVGSSLMVYSGYRFVRMAHAAELPIAIVNRGHTRADPLATLKLDADCATTLAGAADVTQDQTPANNPR